MALIIGPTQWQKELNIANLSLGTSVGGGRLICKSGGTAWIVAPLNTEVSRCRFQKNDAITTAQSVSGCTGWFIPTYAQLQNPGYTCRTYWDSYSSAVYYSNTSVGGNYFRLYNFATGAYCPWTSTGTTPFCARAFRCVTY